MVATLESSSPIARVGFFLNAGARNETGANVGVTHALRAFSNLVCFIITIIAIQSLCFT